MKRADPACLTHHFPPHCEVEGGGRVGEWGGWSVGASLHFIAKLLSFRHGKASQRGARGVSNKQMPFSDADTQPGRGLFDFYDQKTGAVLTACLIFHHKKMALREKQ